MRHDSISGYHMKLGHFHGSNTHRTARPAGSAGGAAAQSTKRGHRASPAAKAADELVKSGSAAKAVKPHSAALQARAGADEVDDDRDPEEGALKGGPSNQDEGDNPAPPEAPAMNPSTASSPASVNVPPPTHAPTAAPAHASSQAPTAPALTGSGGAAPAAGASSADAIKSGIRWAASQYGASADGLIRVAAAESSFNPGAINKTDINAQNGHPSVGVFQFIPTTFADYAKQAYATNPSSWKSIGVSPGSFDINDPRQQALAAAWGFTHGHASAWATQSKY